MSTLRVNTLTTTNGLYTAPLERLVRANVRAWVNFDGTLVTTGLAGVAGSYNVAGITDRGTGWYTVSFSSSMPSSNYAVVGGGSQFGTTTSNDRYLSFFNLTTSSFDVYFSCFVSVQGTNSPLDGKILTAAVISS
jgi:hypothetical protein